MDTVALGLQELPHSERVGASLSLWWTWWKGLAAATRRFVTPGPSWFVPCGEAARQGLTQK